MKLCSELDHKGGNSAGEINVARSPRIISGLHPRASYRDFCLLHKCMASVTVTPGYSSARLVREAT